MYIGFLKRLFDFLGASILMILFCPIIGIISLVLLSLGHGVIFSQLRVGKANALFTLYKFKTMTDSFNLEDSKRVFGFGKFLRSSSLDELPQLWNVLKGEMSFIGPRPLLVEYLPLYSAEQAKRHEITPGITGWAQVKGRNSISWPERFELDLYYVQHRSFWLDVKILGLTILAIFFRRGGGFDNGKLMEKFKG